MRYLRILSVLLVLFTCLVNLFDQALAKEKKEMAKFIPFIQKAKYSSRTGPVVVRRGTFRKLDDKLTAGDYARIGIIEVRYVTQRCTYEGDQEQCKDVGHKNDPTSRLLEMVPKSGGDLVVITKDKKKEKAYEKGEKCSQWGESTTYEYQTDWSTRTQTTRLVTTPVCTKYKTFISVDKLLVSTGVVWRKDAELAKQQRLGINLSAGVISGNLELVKDAVNRGADINLSDMYGNYPLSSSAFFGRKKVVRYLIDSGANVNGRGVGLPPLFKAAEKGHYSIFSMLLKAGAKVKLKDPDTKETILHLAAKGGHPGIVKKLLKKKVKADPSDRYGITPLMLAAANGNEEVARLLIGRKAKVNRKSTLVNQLYANWEPIHFAAFMGKVGALKVLLENGADAQAKDTRGYTPDHLADLSWMMARWDVDDSKSKKEKPGTTRIYEEQARIRERVFNTLKKYIDGRFGYVDAAGKWVVPPIYNSALSFNEGLAAVLASGEWGFVDRSGKMVIKPAYVSTGGFREGLANVAVRIKKDVERHGFIDKTGRMIIPAKFTSADGFYEGLAPVKVNSGNKSRDKGRGGYINRKGRWVIKPTFLRADRFSEGRAAVTLDGKKWGFIDKSGKMVIQPAFGFGGYFSVPIPFSDGLSAVKLESGFYGYVDRSGRMVIPARFKETFIFSEGLAAAIEKRWGFIDRTGRWAFPRKFYYVGIKGGFSEGRCAVQIKKGKWAYIDKTGNYISKARYQNAGPFRNGMAWVRVKDRWGLINRNEKFLIKPRFARATPFTEGLAAVKIEGKEILEFLDK